MKKIFTLIAVALLASVGVQAQTTFKSDSEAPAAGTTLIDDNLVTVKTVYGTTAGTVSTTINGEEFTGYFQLRVDADPTTETPAGTEKSGSTPLVVTAKQNASLTVYYRRQKGTNGYNSDDNKDLLACDQSDLSRLAGTFVINADANEEDAYNVGYKTYTLTAGKTYTLYRKGSTMQIYGIVSAAPTAGINQATADKAVNEDAPVFNLAGQRVSKDYKGVVIQDGKKRINK